MCCCERQIKSLKCGWVCKGISVACSINVVFLQILCSAGYAWLFSYRCGWYVGELLRLKHMAQHFGTLILSGINSTSNPFNQFELLNTALSVIIFQLGPQNFSDFVIWLICLNVPPPSVPLRFAVIASGCASCPRLVCRREGCGAEFCYHCKQAWHPNQTCDSARQQRAQSLHTHSNHSPSYTQEQGPGEYLKPHKPVSITDTTQSQRGTNPRRADVCALCAGR